MWRIPDRILWRTLATFIIGMAVAVLCANLVFVHLLLSSEMIASAFWPIAVVLPWLAIALIVGLRAGRWLVKSILIRSSRPILDVFLVLVMVALVAFRWLDSGLRLETPLHLAAIIILVPLIAGTGLGAGARLFGREP